MTSKLGVYWSVSHRRPQDYDYFSGLQPSVFKIMDGGVPDYQWARDNLPNSLVAARIHALSEQHSDMLSNPVGTGQRHAQEWSSHQQYLGFDRNKTLVLGINEPKVWEANVPEALRLYTIALCDTATTLGLRVGTMQLGVGWPGNNGPDTPPDWSTFGGVEAAIKRNNGALVCHDYWADNGPGENWGWWAGRTLKCPWNVPIVIGECGVDMYVKDASVPHSNRGWLGRMDADRYARELREYVSRMSADARYVGCAVFASDFASHEWFSFDIEPAYQAILNAAEPPALPPIPQPSEPVEIRLPLIEQPKTPTAIIDADSGANIRTGPGLTYKILGAVMKNTPLSVTGKSGDSSWWRVQSEYSDVGWVSGMLVKTYNTQNVPVISITIPVPQEPPQGDTWQRSYAFIKKWEGGYQNVYNDKGNWTGCEVGKGELKGTKYGISACSYPSLDIKNITPGQAETIYRVDYWQKSGADKLPYPACLIVLDTAVLHGVGTAKAWLLEVGPNPYIFAAKRLRSYTKMDNWDFWGKAWASRVADLLEEAG